LPVVVAAVVLEAPVKLVTFTALVVVLVEGDLALEQED
jgi:hypothetical protein